MRQQELLDDEEREQRREENIRAGRIRLQTPRSQPVTNNEIASAPMDEINFLDWGYGDRQPQVKSSVRFKNFRTNCFIRTEIHLRTKY